VISDSVVRVVMEIPRVCRVKSRFALERITGCTRVAQPLPERAVEYDVENESHTNQRDRLENEIDMPKPAEVTAYAFFWVDL
jgi:hypothetical protein